MRHRVKRGSQRAVSGAVRDRRGRPSGCGREVHRCAALSEPEQVFFCVFLFFSPLLPKSPSTSTCPDPLRWLPYSAAAAAAVREAARSGASLNGEGGEDPSAKVKSIFYIIRIFFLTVLLKLQVSFIQSKRSTKHPPSPSHWCLFIYLQGY